ncbi:hypothetical protein MMC25_008205, partial [Agyrium rufum]|nr:hypothetical protein [Agyrium rufum]
MWRQQFKCMRRSFLTLGPTKPYLRRLLHYGPPNTPPTNQVSQRGLAKEAKPSVRERLMKRQARYPQWIQRYTGPLINAPGSVVASFLILHELTAVVPLFGLVGVFHFTGWMPSWFSQGKWASDGMEKFGNYARKKGWLGQVGEDGKQLEKRGVWWGRGESGARWMFEFGTAWAVVKVLLPLRIVISVWAAPAFARMLVEPMTRVVR